jgi:uncharacterized delta-60 repeat protein
VALQRLKPNGNPNISFGTNNTGIELTPIGSSNDSANSVVVNSDDTFLVAGATNAGTNEDFVLARFTDNGALDNSFGTGGLTVTNIGPSNDAARDLALQADGKIVVVGSTFNGTDYDFAVARYLANGTLDSSFATGGFTTNPIGALDDTNYAVAIEANGKIAAVGATDTGANYSFALAKYNP